MRLRRETGDFSITLVPRATDPMQFDDVQLPKGLSAEDFVGQVICIKRTIRDAVTTTTWAITRVEAQSEAPYLYIPFSESGLYYNIATGILSTTEPPLPDGPSETN